MQISKATLTDLDAILRLQTQIYRLDKPAEGAQSALKIQIADESCDILVAKDNGNVVATATIYYIAVAVRTRPYALLEGLVVDQSKRGHGIGTALFEKCIEICQK